MRAIRVDTTDGPGAALLADVPAPEAGEDVLIDVHAAGVSFPELLLCRGEYQMKPELPFVPGSEVAGTVVAAPPGSVFAAGDRVAAFGVYGGWAEQVAVREHAVFPLPPEVSYGVGAALPMNYLTGHFELVRRARLEKGETVLVHGAAGGVGTAAIQIARAYGARVIAVASTQAKRDLAHTAGADHVVDVTDFAAVVRELTDGDGVDIVVNPVGGDRSRIPCGACAPRGACWSLGSPAETSRRCGSTGCCSTTSRWWESRGEPTGCLVRRTSPSSGASCPRLLRSGALAPVVGHRFPLAAAGDALRLLEGRGAVGKTVLDVRPPEEST